MFLFLETCHFGLIYLVEEVGGCDIDQFFKVSFLRHRYLFFGKMHFWIDLLVSPKPKSIFIIFPQIIETSSRFYLKPLVSKSMENCGQTAMSLGNIIFCVTLTSTMNLGKEYCMFHGWGQMAPLYLSPRRLLSVGWLSGDCWQAASILLAVRLKTAG